MEMSNARHGKSVQEVFIVTDLSQQDLKSAIEACYKNE